MNDFKLFAKCEFCRKRKLYIAKRSVPLPIGRIATSQKKMCKRCYVVLLEALNK